MPKWQIQTQINWLGHQPDYTSNATVDDYETVDLTINAKRLWNHVNLSASVRNLFNSHGKEPAVVSSYPNNLPIPSQSFYLEASVHF